MPHSVEERSVVYGCRRSRPSHATNIPGLTNPTPSLDLVAHIIQVALAPVFLLSGIGILLNVFSTRLARVADLITKAIEGSGGSGGEETEALAAYLSHLHWRTVALDVAVVLDAVAGAFTCASVLTLFVGALKDATIASMLFATFGLAVICTFGAIGAFAAEVLMAGSGMQAQVAARRRSSKEG